MFAADDRLDVLIDRFYDAAVGVCGWDAVLRDLTKAFGAAFAAFGIVGRAPRPHPAHRHRPRPGRTLPAAPCRAERARAPHRAPAGRDRDHRYRPDAQGRVPPHRLLPGLPAAARARQPDEPPRARGTPTGWRPISACSAPPQQGDFGAAEVAAYERLAPHLCRAVALHLRVAEAEGERRALVGTLETLPRAALLVDGAMRVLRTNQAGATLLAARDGLQTDRAEGGALRARQCGGDRGAAADGGCGGRRPRPGRRGPCGGRRRASLPVAAAADAAAADRRRCCRSAPPAPPPWGCRPRPRRCCW